LNSTRRRATTSSQKPGRGTPRTSPSISLTPMTTGSWSPTSKSLPSSPTMIKGRKAKRSHSASLSAAFPLRYPYPSHPSKSLKTMPATPLGPKERPPEGLSLRIGSLSSQRFYKNGPAKGLRSTGSSTKSELAISPKSRSKGESPAATGRWACSQDQRRASPRIAGRAPSLPGSSGSGKRVRKGIGTACPPSQRWRLRGRWGS
jgi:hypothetical protein